MVVFLLNLLLCFVIILEVFQFSALNSKTISFTFSFPQTVLLGIVAELIPKHNNINMKDDLMNGLDAAGNSQQIFNWTTSRIRLVTQPAKA